MVIKGLVLNFSTMQFTSGNSWTNVQKVVDISSLQVMKFGDSDEDRPGTLAKKSTEKFTKVPLLV